MLVCTPTSHIHPCVHTSTLSGIQARCWQRPDGLPAGASPLLPHPKLMEEASGLHSPPPSLPHHPPHPHKQGGRGMVVGNIYKAEALEVLKGKPRADEAKDIITRVAKQVMGKGANPPAHPPHLTTHPPTSTTPLRTVPQPTHPPTHPPRSNPSWPSTSGAFASSPSSTPPSLV